MKKDGKKSDLAKILWATALLVFLIGLPFFLSGYWQDVLVLLTINVILVMSYRLITTMGGWSFAHIAVMGLGAYAMAMLTTKYYHISFWITLPIGGLVSAIFALLISYPVLRTKQFYFFLSTFAAGEALRQCFIQFVKVFGGIEGIAFIERPHAIIGFDFNDNIDFYYLTLALAIITGMILYRLDKCRIGRITKAASANDALSEAIGINTWGYKALAFIIGSFFAGVAGVLFGNYNGIVAPTDYNSVFMFKIVASAIIGGTRTFTGPILGLLFLTMLNEVLRDMYQWVPLLYGVCIIAVLLFIPHGLESQLKWIQFGFEEIRLKVRP